MSHGPRFLEECVVGVKCPPDVSTWAVSTSVRAVYAPWWRMFGVSRLFDLAYSIGFEGLFNPHGIEDIFENVSALVLMEHGRERSILIVDDEIPFVLMAYTPRRHQRRGWARLAMAELARQRNLPLERFYGKAVSEEGSKLLFSFSTAPESGNEIRTARYQILVDGIAAGPVFESGSRARTVRDFRTAVQSRPDPWKKALLAQVFDNAAPMPVCRMTNLLRNLPVS